MSAAHDLGVELFRVDGVYRRGATRDNLQEATKVVDRVLHHGRQHPRATIGVVALSTAQQLAVEAEIERRAAHEPELRELEANDRLSGFFVKNLESVQGDERDIVILTIGYGPDENDRLTMNFGPINREGGERRLNVAVTRARRRIEIVTSISGGDIRVSGGEARSDAGGLAHLRSYLDFAERGRAALAVDLRAPPDHRGPRPAPKRPVVETVPTDLDARPDWACDYVEPRASAPPPTTAEFHDPALRDVIVAQICEVVDDHSPIHRDAVLRVVRKAWRRGRVGNLMRRAFDSALARAVAERGIEQHGDWLHSRQRMTVVRVPASDDAPRRPVEEVPPDEIELTIMHLLEDAGASRNADLREAWARLYGWKRVGPDIERAFDRAVRALIEAGKVNGPDSLRLANREPR